MTNRKNNSQNYQAKLEVFAKVVAGGQQASVELIKTDGSLTTGWFLRVQGGQRCDCCGTKRLKIRYPIKKEEQVYWIGTECLAALLEMNAIKGSSIFSSPTVIVKDMPCEVK